MLWILVPACLAVFVGLGDGNPRVIDDFEGKAAIDHWKPSQGAKATLGEDSGSKPSTGHVLTIDAPDSGIVATTSSFVPKDWRGLETLSFRIRRESPPTPVAIEIWLIEKDKQTRFWRKVTLDQEGWTPIRLPLRFFRFGAGRVPNAGAIDRLAFYFRDAAKVSIDDLTVEDEPRGPGMTIPTDELAAIAFSDPSLARTATRDQLEVLTDAKDLDVEKLADRLVGVLERVRREVELPSDRKGKARLIVFADESAYRSFPDRLAGRFDSSGSRPASDGFTLFGIGTGYFDPATGIDRPTFTHEVVHSCLTVAGGFDNSGEWFQEGFASWIQLQFHPQSNLASIVNDGLDDEPRRLPLARLLDGRSIPSNRYWQAAVFVEFLLSESGRFPELVRRMRESGSTKLEPHLATVLKTDWAALQTEWVAWCRKRYPL